MSPKLESASDETVEASPSVAERRALIERIAASEQFGRSARLRDFLLYVGLQSLKNGCPGIHEHEIGAKVFGRAPSYDRSQDNIVRVNATELRKRISAYFESQGAHEPLILEIPRGTYMPVFRWRVLSANPPETKSATPIPDKAEPVASRQRIHPWWIASLATLCLILLVLCAFLFRRDQKSQKALYPWTNKPALAALWVDFLSSHPDTDIILPDASVSLSEEIMGHPISLADYLDHTYITQAGPVALSPDRREDLQRIFNHNLVALGDFHAAQQLLALAPRLSSLHLTLARFYGADYIKRDNVILIGGKKANPWVDLFDSQMNFSLDYNNAQGQAYITNRHPKPGEQAVYQPLMNRNALTGYSVVAYLPNPSQTGKVIIIAGTDSDATSAAAGFLTQEEPLAKFRDSLHAKDFPYFEVLLKTSRLNGTSFSAQPLAYRTYP